MWLGYTDAESRVDEMMREGWIVETISSGSSAVIVILRKEVK
jgi:hypothetical protein